MANIVIPYAAVTQQPTSSVGINSNFAEVANKFNAFAVQTDVAKTVNVAHTWAVSQTWSTAQTMPGMTMTGDQLFTDALYDIGKTGATRPRDGFFSRNVTIGATLTAVTLAGALPAASLTGNFTQDMLFTDALFDIGKSGATRPRDGFFSRNLTVGGQAIFTSTTQPIKLQSNAQIVWRNFGNTADAFGIGTDVTDNLRVGVDANFAALWLGFAGKKLSFYGAGGVGGVVQPVIVGAKGGNVALANLLTALGAANLNLVTDNTT